MEFALCRVGLHDGGNRWCYIRCSGLQNYFKSVYGVFGLRFKLQSAYGWESNEGSRLHVKKISI